MLIKLCLKVGISFVLCGCVFGAAVEGELKVWHNVTLSFDGPKTSEQATPNPFMDYRLDVTFTGPSGQQYAVPGGAGTLVAVRIPARTEARRCPGRRRGLRPAESHSPTSSARSARCSCAPLVPSARRLS